MTACSVKGSGVIINKIISPSPENFTEVEIQGIYDFEIVKSDEYSVEIITDDNIFQYLSVKKESGVLKLNIKKDETYKGVTLRAKIMMPELTAITLIGNCQGVFKDFDNTEELSITLDGSNTLYPSNADARRLVIGMDGSNSINMKGSAEKLELEMDGSNSLNLKDVSGINEASVDMDGSNVALISIDGDVSGEVSGNSILYLYGKPVLRDLVTSGASDVELLD